MSRYDRMSSLFFVGVAFVISIESIRLGPGSLSNPGPGLIPLGCGLVLGILGLIVFSLSMKRAENDRGILWKPGIQWGKIISIIMSILGYAFLVNPLGFHLITFLWMCYVCWRIGGMGLKVSIFTSVVTVASCYFVFERILAIHFPKGVFGF
jgi:hypothetical protein